jgi:ribosomal-protein-alanine N-acetyltransferase
MPIRPASLADVPAMRTLLVRSPGVAQWSEAQLKELLGAGAPHRLSLVIESNESLSGFLVARSIAAEWELENIVIAESARRSGLGSQLLSALLEHARSSAARAIFLEVRESNLPARRLYEKFGFQPSGRRPGYYRGPCEDALLYSLDLL